MDFSTPLCGKDGGWFSACDNEMVGQLCSAETYFIVKRLVGTGHGLGWTGSGLTTGLGWPVDKLYLVKDVNIIKGQRMGHGWSRTSLGMVEVFNSNHMLILSEPSYI